jgi:hypothetical protein
VLFVSRLHMFTINRALEEYFINHPNHQIFAICYADEDLTKACSWRS